MDFDFPNNQNHKSNGTIHSNILPSYLQNISCLSSSPFFLVKAEYEVTVTCTASPGLYRKVCSFSPGRVKKEDPFME